MSDYSIEAKQINISFDGVQVLHDVDFYLKSGEVHALLGTNGAGKSTLVKILNGAYKKDSGSISVFGEVLNYHSPEAALQSGIAMVFQDLSLIPSLTVSENIFLRTHPFRKGPLIDDRKGREMAVRFLEMTGVDAEISPDDRIEDLSVGKQQIVEIAKALSHNPKILILDEPTASLTGTEIERLFDVISSLRDRGISVIYITHYLQDVYKVCDGITLLRDGRVVFRKSTSEIDLATLVDAMAGGESKAVSWNRRNIDRSEASLLEVKHLTTEHIDDVSLSVYPGEIVGIAGLLGSGRTELLRALFGIDRVVSGDILIEEKPESITSSADAIELGISMVPEDRREQGLVLDFSVSENMVLPIVSRLRRNLMVDTGKTSELVGHYIDALNVKTQGQKQVVRYLSGGNQQKIVVAKCLASESRILLLDDPTFGVDIHAKYEIMGIIEDFASLGNGVIFVSSEFAEIADYCDSIYVMKKGRIVEHVSDRVDEEQLLHLVQ